MFESLLERDASYLCRLGLLCALLCGACVLLGIVLMMLQPCASNMVATAVALVMTLAGLRLARRS